MGGVDKTRSGGAERATSRDVARLAGVSHTAVSFVFNGRAEGNLSAATQRRIREAASQLGYRPDPVARGLRRRRTAVIGLVTHLASPPPRSPGAVLRGTMNTAWDREHLVLTVDSSGDPETGGRRNRRTAEPPGRRHHLRGHVAAQQHQVPAGLQQTYAVLANCLPADNSLPAVVPAAAGRGRAAVRLLLDAGHRRIAFVGGLDDIASSERLRGFRDG